VEEYAVVPPVVFDQLRGLVAQTRHGKQWQYEIDLGFRAPDPEGVLTIGGAKFKRGEALGETWDVNTTDVEDVLRHVRDARRQSDVVLMAFHAHDMAGDDPDSVPPFHREFCRACLDAGCDAVIGHGPHRLRGIEVYGGKPIFYSLGNFIFQNEEAAALPADFYERLGIDPVASTPGDGFDRRNSRGAGGFAGDAAFWETVVAAWEMADARLTGARLYPIVLGFGKPRAQRGRPLVARSDAGRRIIERMDGLCRPLGTRVEWHQDGYGVLRW
jgi:poly-gamma-glutamate synthesis protein (capsule biosynthesis protein)